jgi:transcription elongation factor Elf1
LQKWKKYIQDYDCETILFNIDAIANINSRNQKNAIVEVCMKAFYKHLGFHYIKSWLAHKERKLRLEWKYDEFTSAYQEITWRTWNEWRVDIELEQNFAARALIKIKPEYDEESARKWFEDKYQHDQYHLSAEEFATIINQYCDKAWWRKKLFFMIDEVGQYIGKDSQLMLNLQTVVELLWTTWRGKSRLVVTSQEALDEVTKMEWHWSLDFSKIKWRFTTQLSLSSSNVDEVIQKRLLEKTNEAKIILANLYQKEEQHLRNMISFDSYDHNFYRDQWHFVSLYPLFPYQVNLVRESLHAIWNIWYAGSYLARWERSLLTFFQQTLKSRADQEIGVLVKFSDIYDAVEWWIDSYIKQTISRAQESDHINELGVDILKVLFLLKYVKDMPLTLDNITTLLVDHIDTDKILLKNNIQESLNVLQKHNYINKRAEDYEFLSNEEQEIEHQINNITIDPIDVYNQMYDLIFENIHYGLSNKYQYDKSHSFAFKKMIDEYEKLNIDSPLCLKIITSRYEQKELVWFSFWSQTIRIELPKPNSDEDNYWQFLFKCKKNWKISHTTHEICWYRKKNNDEGKRKRFIIRKG